MPQILFVLSAYLLVTSRGKDLIHSYPHTSNINKLLFVTYFLGICGHNQTSLLNYVVNNLDQNNACSVLATSESGVQVSNSRPLTLINVTNPKRLLRYSILLRLNSFCVISVVETNSQVQLAKIIAVTRILDNHKIVYLGNRAPPQGVLTMINRPLIWINTGGRKVFKFCQVSVKFACI